MTDTDIDLDAVRAGEVKDLVDADLSDAHLQHADLRNATLEDATLWNASPWDADLDATRRRRCAVMTDPYDRKPHGFAYNGTTLVAVGYTDGIVSHWEEATNYVVSRTPEGLK